MNNFEKIVVTCLLVIMAAMMYSALKIKEGVEEVKTGVAEVKKITGDIQGVVGSKWFQSTMGSLIADILRK